MDPVVGDRCLPVGFGRRPGDSINCSPDVPPDLAEPRRVSLLEQKPSNTRAATEHKPPHTDPTISRTFPIKKFTD